MADVAEAQTKAGRVTSENQAEEGAAGTSARRSFARNPRMRRLVLAAVVLLAIGALGLWWYFSGRESTDDAQIDGHIVPISAKVGGTVQKVHIEENQYVEAGTVLVEIDPRDYEVALAAAQAELANAQATALAAHTGIPIASTTTGSQLSTSEARALNSQAALAASQKEVDAARARRRAAQAHLEEVEARQVKAAHDLDRMKQLIAKDEISRQDYDAAVATADTTKAAVASVEADVAAAQQAELVAESRVEQARAMLAVSQAEVRGARIGPQQVAVTRAQAKSAEARVKQAQAALDQAQLNLQYATVRAPQRGVISKKTVEPGEIVQPGQPLLAIVPLEDIWVTANFKETQLKKMRVGQHAVISVDAYGRRKYNGYVQSIAAATGERFSLLPPENATGNYVKVVQRVPVRIYFDKGQDPEHLLRPGMSVGPTVFVR